MSRALVCLVSFVLFINYGAGSAIRSDNSVIAEPIPVDSLDDIKIDNVGTSSIVALQGGVANPPRQCAGIGQACSTHVDCCTSSCFGILRTCIPNLGLALNIQIGRDEIQV